MAQIFCAPSACPNCQYVGDGGFLCDETMNIVVEDWEPTEDYMGEGCPYAKKNWRKKK